MWDIDGTGEGSESVADYTAQGREGALRREAAMGASGRGRGGLFPGCLGHICHLNVMVEKKTDLFL